MSSLQKWLANLVAGDRVCMLRQTLVVRATCIVYVMLLASCVILPIPSTTERTPGFSEGALQSVYMGTTRAEVLMALGNPDLIAYDYRYIGYRTTGTAYDWFFAFSTGFGGIGGATVSPGPSEEQVLMFEFDSDGKAVRMERFSNTNPVELRADIRQWIQTTVRPAQ